MHTTITDSLDRLIKTAPREMIAQRSAFAFCQGQFVVLSTVDFRQGAFSPLCGSERRSFAAAKGKLLAPLANKGLKAPCLKNVDKAPAWVDYPASFPFLAAYDHPTPHPRNSRRDWLREKRAGPGGRASYWGDSRLG